MFLAVDNASPELLEFCERCSIRADTHHIMSSTRTYISASAKMLVVLQTISTTPVEVLVE